jgi:L-iditol 2-dehydrogenase
LRALKPLGQYTQVGIFGREVSIEFDLIFYKQLRVAGSVGYSVATWERLLKIIDQRAIRVDDLITHKMPLERWRDAFDLCLNKQAIKVLLSPAT